MGPVSRSTPPVPRVPAPVIAQHAPARPAPTPRQWWLGAAVLFIAAVGIGILDSSPREPLAAPRTLLGSVLSPVARAGAAIHGTSEAIWSAVLGRRELEQQNEELRREVAEMRLRGAIDSAQHTVSGARSAIAPSLPTDARLLDAAVLGTAPTSGRQLLWVSRGSADGVEPGMVVVGAQGIVGTVNKVFAGSCLVAMIADGRSRWGAVGADSGETVVIAGAGEPSVAHVLFGATETMLRPGEVLLSSGQAGSSAPGGIPIGTMRELTRSRTGEAVGIVDLAEDPRSSRVVFIMSSRQLPAAPPAK